MIIAWVQSQPELLAQAELPAPAELATRAELKVREDLVAQEELESQEESKAPTDPATCPRDAATSHCVHEECAPEGKWALGSNAATALPSTVPSSAGPNTAAPVVHTCRSRIRRNQANNCGDLQATQQPRRFQCHCGIRAGPLRLRRWAFRRTRCDGN